MWFSIIIILNIYPPVGIRFLHLCDERLIPVLTPICINMSRMDVSASLHGSIKLSQQQEYIFQPQGHIYHDITWEYGYE